jgi:hypothetical protein
MRCKDVDARHNGMCSGRRRRTRVPGMTKLNAARHELNVRHDRVSSDHFRREPYPSQRDPHGGSSRQGRVRTWAQNHAAYRHVRACRLIEHDPDPKGRVSAKWRAVFPSGQTRSVCPEIMLNHIGSDGSSLATLRRSVGRMWRRDVRPPSDSKSPRIKKPATGFRRGLNSCDVEHMPVICPTCQIISKCVGRNARLPTP